MSDQPTQEQMEEIESALASGNKIGAIKICREVTGKGLKESKEFIEALIPELQERDPEKYAKLSQGAGCALVFVGFTTAALIWIVQSWA